MKNILLLIAWMGMGFTAFSQGLTPEVLLKNNDSLFCFTLPQSKTLVKLIENGAYSDSIAKAREAEAKELAQMGMRMQHNIDLLGKVNDDLRQEIQLSEGQTVNCEKEKEVIIKSNKRDKTKKIIVSFLVGALIGAFAAHF